MLGNHGPVWKVEDVCHIRESYEAKPAATVFKEDSVSLVQVSLVKWNAVMVKVGMGVFESDFTVELDGLLPVLRLVVPNISPLMSGMVWAVPAGRTRWFRPSHTTHQIDAFAPVHPLLNEDIPVHPSVCGLGNPLHFISANSNPKISRLNPLRYSPAMSYTLLPFIGAISGEFSIFATLVCENGHQDGFAILPAPYIYLGKQALGDSIKGHAYGLQCWRNDFIHVGPSSGLFSFCVHDDCQIRRRNPSRNDECRNRSRLHTATRRPNLSSFHASLSTR